jgi:hypothetical protein
VFHIITQLENFLELLNDYFRQRKYAKPFKNKILMETSIALPNTLILPSLRNQGWTKDTRVMRHSQMETSPNLKGPIIHTILQMSGHSPTISGYSELKTSHLVRNLMSSSPNLDAGSIKSRSPKTSVSPHPPHGKLLGKRVPTAHDKDKKALESYPWENQGSDFHHDLRGRHPLAMSPCNYEQPSLNKHRSEQQEDNPRTSAQPGRKRRELIIRLTIDDPDDSSHPLRPISSPRPQTMESLLRLAASKIVSARFEDPKPLFEPEIKKRSYHAGGDYLNRDPAKEFLQHCITKEKKFNKRVQTIETYFDERKEGLLKMLDDL